MQGDYGNMAEQEVISKYNYVAEARKNQRRNMPVPSNTRARQLAVEHL